MKWKNSESNLAQAEFPLYGTESSYENEPFSDQNLGDRRRDRHVLSMNFGSPYLVTVLKFLFGAAGLIGIVFGTIGVVFISKTNPNGAAPIDTSVKVSSHQAPEDAITFDEFVDRKFSAKSFNGSWWSEEELQWSDQNGNLVAWNFNTNETSIIVSNEMLASVSKGTKFMGFSGDNTMILFAYEIESVWRHSFTARYLVLDTNTNKTTEILAPDGGSTLQYCDWIDQGQFESALIYVYQNNLYFRNNAVEEDDIAITEDGVIDNVFNGIPDWVYEEEVLASNDAHYISPDGYKIAFAQFNDTLVKDFKYPNYGDPSDVINAQYPTYKTVRYPKSGETNPIAKLFVRQFSEEKNKDVIPPQKVIDWQEYIFTDVNWITENKLSVVWMNRIQNESVLCICEEEAVSWQCSILNSVNQENGWLEPGTPFVSDLTGTAVITIQSTLQNDNRHYPHVVKIMMDGTVVPLTQGYLVVTDILDWDEDEMAIYFMGTDDRSPGSRHLYSVDEHGNGFMTCLTCNLKSLAGGVCDYNEVFLNFESTHFVHICRGKDIPEVTLRNLPDCDIIYTLEENKPLRDALQNKTLPTRIDTTFSVEGNFSAPVKISLPPHMVPGEKYPMIVYVYGGPGSQMVDNRWSIGWGEYLVTSRNIIYVSIDGRGTGFQSDEHKFQVYRNLGTVEMVDQIAVAKKLAETYDYIDPSKVAIWGWSYGGFATAMTLEQDVGPSPVFSCGISVAPVTSWLLYDSVYTERYMALPSENMNGYNNSVINGIENLKTKKWMLNHGVADDNVHFQQTMLLTRALEIKDIQFEQHSYPDENHSLGGVSRFLYHAMNDFWTRCFNL